MPFQLRDDLAGTLFRRAGDAAAGETGAKGTRVVDVGAQTARDGRNEVKHLREALHAPQLRHLHAAKLAHLAQIVALEVRDHEQLGFFLLRGPQLVLRRHVPLHVPHKTRPRALDRPRGDVWPVQTQKGLHRRAEHRGAVQPQKRRMRRGRDRAQFQVKGQRVRLFRPAGHPGVGQVHLINIPRGDVVLRAAHHRHKLLFRDLRLKKQRRRRIRHRRVHGGDLKIAKRAPAARVVLKHRAVRIHAEREFAIVAHPAVKTAVHGPRHAQRRAHAPPIALDVPAQHLHGLRRDHADRSRACERRIHPHQALAMVQGRRHLLRRRRGKGSGGQFHGEALL